MSGPKVIRIVTREEALAACQPLLDRVDAALAEWERLGTRNGVLDDVVREGVRARRAELARMLEQPNVVPFQKAAPLMVEFLQNDVAARLEARLEEQREARRREAAAARSVAGTAAALLATCAARGVELPEEVKQGLARGEQAAVARAFQLLPTGEGLTEAQRALAARLGDGTPPQTIEAWLASQEAADPRREAAEREALRLAQLGGDPAPFERRLEALQAERDTDRRDLLLDSLLLEMRAAVKTTRETGLLRQQAAAHPDIVAMVDAGRLEEARAALAAIDEQRQRMAAERAAVERRRLLLEGLRNLGYDVREGMATAWARQGKVVVRGPEPGTGVELAGKGDRLQARVIAWQDPTRTPTADKQAEETWCADVARLQALLASQGSALHIDRATPAGQEPLKTVPADFVAYEEEAAPRHLTAD